MKKTINKVIMMLLMLILLSTPFFSFPVSATGGYCGESGSNLEWDYQYDILIISGTGKMADFSSGKTPWVAYSKTIVDIVFGPGITRIGHRSFQNLTALTSVTIPEGVESIGIDAFSNCTALKTVNLPYSLKAIAAEAFIGCKSLENIQLPGNLKIISDNAFCNCQSLTDIIVPYGVTHLNSNAFQNCYNLKRIVIPYTVTTISLNALANCANVSVVCAEDSNAHSYAIEGSLPYRSLQSGDVNGDEKNDIKDLIRLKKYLADAGALVSDAADVDKSGEINLIDLVSIRKQQLDIN